jgi:hypothetical protein
MATSRNPRRPTPRRRPECPDDLLDYAQSPPQRRLLARWCPASNDVEAALGFAWPYAGRPPKDDISAWTVTDDWLEHVPVTSAEVDVFEAWFGDVFDELFGPCQ